MDQYYMGCYADYSNKRDIFLTYTYIPSELNIEFCIGICLNTGYTVAGLQRFDNRLIFYFIFVC